MTIEVGDKVLLIPDGKGGYLAQEIQQLKDGDKCLLFPNEKGGFFAVKTMPPAPGDNVLIIPTRTNTNLVLYSEPILETWYATVYSILTPVVTTPCPGPSDSVYIASTLSDVKLFKDGAVLKTFNTQFPSWLIGGITLNPDNSKLIISYHNLGINYHLKGYDTDTTNLLWNFTTTNAIYAPLIMLSNGSVVVRDDGGNVYCVDSSDGSQIWAYAIDAQSYSSARGSIAIDTSDNAYFGTKSGRIYKITTAGTVSYNTLLGDACNCTPSISQFNGDIIISTNANYLYRYDSSFVFKRFLLTSFTGSTASKPAIDNDGNIYIANTNGNIFKFDYKLDILGSYTTPAAVNSSVIFCPVNDLISFTAEDYKIYFLNRDMTLNQAIDIYPYGTTTIMPNYSTPVENENGIIFVGSHDGQIFAIYL